MSKRKIEETIQKITNENIPNKRAIDLYRERTGNLQNILIKDLMIDNYTFARLSLSDSIFENVKFVGCKFQGQDFTNIKLDNVEFDNCDLRWVTLRKEQLDSNTFVNCDKREIDVIG